MRRVFFFALLVALGGCFEKKTDASASPRDARASAGELAATLTGDDKGAAADNAVCKLFKAKELEPYVGEALGKPENAAMGSGCQWPAKDETGDVLIQVVPKEYYEPHTGAETYQEIKGLGERAFSAHAFDGWLASALVGERAIVAMVAGETASRETAEALLRETVKRVGAQ